MLRKSAALNSATQYAMPPDFGGKWETEFLNTRFRLHSLLCAGYSVKLILYIEHYYAKKSHPHIECRPKNRNQCSSYWKMAIFEINGYFIAFDVKLLVM